MIHDNVYSLLKVISVYVYVSVCMRVCVCVCVCVYSFFFLGLHMQHIEVPRLGVESEQQVLASIAAVGFVS